MPLKKTNVMRLLDSAGIAYEFYEYDVSDGHLDAVSVARKIGRKPEQVFKTLVTRGDARDHFVFAGPGGLELDMKRAAVAAGCKSVEMLPLKELLPLTGYVHGGCSPVGMKKNFPTFIDETALLYDSICVSAGKVGLNVCLNPEELARFTGASFVPLTKDKD